VRTAFAAQLTEIEDELERGLREVPAALTLIVAEQRTLAAQVGDLLTTDGLRLRARCRSADAALMTVVACQAPVAGDLRLVLALLQVSHHASLISNQLALIGVQLHELSGLAACHGTEDRLAQMVVLAGSQLDAAVTAFCTRRPDAVRQIDRHDSSLDRLNREVFACARDLDGPSARRATGLRHVLIARSIERIGDNAVGIARLSELVTGARPEDVTGSRSLGAAG
jgi:phosphate transport system protein